MEKIQNFLYKTVPGRIILKPLVQPPITKLGGLILSTRLSALYVDRFIKNNRIDMSDYEERKYRSFNDFFTRTILPGKRPFDESPASLISPCDSALTVYDINESSQFHIKSSVYTAEELIGENADGYSGGKCLVFRLAVHNYHRYCFIDSGSAGKTKKIKGVFHTVMPISEEYKVFARNSREDTLLHTDNFGDVHQIEVGALMVGKISNRIINGNFRRGEEKGMFEFGGSTIVLLLKKEAAEIRPDITENSKKGIETPVKYGEKIGWSTKSRNPRQAKTIK